MKYICKVYWEVYSEVVVDADSETDAACKAMDAPLPKDSQYVSDSINCDPDCDVSPI